ncbi:hypothetical protein LCL61_11055 [Amycolatopsis coloradensis]|uniref:Uncharacterized protein n=1 Tax=Amycolatopsis coloradensis TaxID=76021 RepID=A0ACD5BA24_9PSEU
MKKNYQSSISGGLSDVIEKRGMTPIGMSGMTSSVAVVDSGFRWRGHLGTITGFAPMPTLRWMGLRDLNMTGVRRSKMPASGLFPMICDALNSSAAFSGCNLGENTIKWR